MWLGVTVENQHYADERIPLLLDTPVAVHWLSMEPLLGPIELPEYALRRLDWGVCGGESGAQARTMDIEWALSLRRSFQRAGIAFYMKQLSQRDTASFKEFESFPLALQVRDFPG